MSQQYATTIIALYIAMTELGLNHEYITAWNGGLCEADFKTVSCNSFWAFLATPGGEKIARDWMKDLKADFKTVSCSGF